ncbi:MAG: TRAP transporter small permease [Alphaproteobacteria bacterium]|nr:TRAP transporter small permease [Alphaproteobacteria bacterium]
MSEMQGLSPSDDSLDRALGILSSIPLGLIVVLTFIDVFARYLISAPIKGSLEIIQYAMALSIFAALPLVTRHRGHVTVSLIDGMLGVGALRFKTIVCDLISLLALGLMSWRLWVYASESTEQKQQTIVLALPQGPLVYALSVFAALTSVLVLIDLWRQFGRSGDAS